MGWWTRFKRIVRYYFLRIIRQGASAHSIALGVALGVFIGALPIIPLQTAAVLVLAFVFRANKISAVICTTYTNVFTLVPFYALFYLTGAMTIKLFGFSVAHQNLSLHELMVYFRTLFHPEDTTMREMLAHGWRFFMVMLLGGVILGVPASFGSYFLTRLAVLGYRRRRAKRILRRLRQP